MGLISTEKTMQGGGKLRSKVSKLSNQKIDIERFRLGHANRHPVNTECSENDLQ